MKEWVKLECRGGPLDGEFIADIGSCNIYESERGLSYHYHRCDHGHYHYTPTPIPAKRDDAE